jgi:hypothetical protein
MDHKTDSELRRYFRAISVVGSARWITGIDPESRTVTMGPCRQRLMAKPSISMAILHNLKIPEGM